MTDPRFHDLTELSRRMTSSLDLRALTEDLVSWTIRETGAVIAAITLWDRERDVLVALTNLEVEALGLTTPSGEVYGSLADYPATRRVLEDLRTLSTHVDRPGDDPAEQTWLREHGMSAGLVLPLVSGGKAIGAMESRVRRVPSPEVDVAYCELVCDMAGSAVQNAKLHGELESTLAQYQSLIERLPAVTYLDDLETGASQFVSPQVEKLFGITQEEWLASPDAWLANVHPDDRELAGRAFAEASKARQPVRQEYRVVSPDGVGIRLFPFDAADAQALLQHADAAMYQAKAAGRDASSVYQPGERDAQGQLELAVRLRKAIAADELVLHFQPVVELSTGTMTGVEALIRWEDPVRGMIPPDDFIPLAERTGLIRPISEWVIAEASRQASVWQAAGDDHAMSINVPPDTCQQIGAEAIGRLIRSAGGEPSRLTLEMTESAMMTPRRGQNDELAALRALGIRLAIDDFGTGHSSLGRLGELPVTFLKIDRSFVRGLPELDTARMLVTAIMYLAKGFGLEVIAEGVETEAQREFLLDSGCRYARGYLFSPAVEADQISDDWLSGAVSVGQTAELLA